jgi:hypothetical protein
VFIKSVLLGLCLPISTAFAQQSDRVELGSLETGETVVFVRTAGGEWGIEISGGTSPRLTQQKPAQIEIFRMEEDIRELAAGHKTVQQSAAEIDACAEIELNLFLPMLNLRTYAARQIHSRESALYLVLESLRGTNCGENELTSLRISKL